MWPDRVSNPGPLTYKSGALPIALRGPAGPGFNTQSGHILLFLLPLIQEEQLSVTGEKYVHEVLINRLGGLSLPSKSVVRLTDRPGITLECLPWR